MKMAFCFLYANPFNLSSIDEKKEFYTYFGYYEMLRTTDLWKLPGDFNLSSLFDNDVNHLATIEDGQLKMKFVDNSIRTTGDLIKDFGWEMLSNIRNDTGTDLDLIFFKGYLKYDRNDYTKFILSAILL